MDFTLERKVSVVSYLTTLIEGPELTEAWPFNFPTPWPQVIGSHWVYVLKDADGRVCYVGETHHLRTRLKRHGQTKEFVSWFAYRAVTRCTGRLGDCDPAQALESLLIELLDPYLYNDGRRRA